MLSGGIRVCELEGQREGLKGRLNEIKRMRCRELKTYGSLAMCVFMLPGCATNTPKAFRIVAHYDSALTQVDRKTDDASHSSRDIIPDANTRYVFTDDIITGTFFAVDSSIRFKLSNHSDHTINVVWTATALIDPDGRAFRVTHEGEPGASLAKPQPPSLITPYRDLDEYVIPCVGVYYRYTENGLDLSKPAGWNSKSLFEPATADVKTGKEFQLFSAAVRAKEGRKWGLRLPLEIAGATTEYTFWFEVLRTHLESPVEHVPEAPGEPDRIEPSADTW